MPHTLANDQNDHNKKIYLPSNPDLIHFLPGPGWDAVMTTRYGGVAGTCDQQEISQEILFDSAS